MNLCSELQIQANYDTKTASKLWATLGDEVDVRLYEWLPSLVVDTFCMVI